jgi:UDP-N-acetylglucosamine 2-epimerase (non-hydrolysing)
VPGGSAVDAIVEQTLILLNDKDRYAEMATAVNPYGDGKASHRIANVLLDDEVD